MVRTMFSNLLDAIEASNLTAAREELESLLRSGVDPWTIHEAMFPLVHRVLNPPFINPHLPKMYGINRELITYLPPEDIPKLVHLEVEEYTRREKSPQIPKPTVIPEVDRFSRIEKTIAKQNVESTAKALLSFLQNKGPKTLIKHLLILGSRYLDQSLGHSLSCTAFILLELNVRREEDPWPVLVAIAQYFCRGNFHQKPDMQYSAISDYPEVFLIDMKRAVSGTGIVALHHTITLYAIERSRHLYDHQDYDHLLTMWSTMLGQKKEELYPVDELPSSPLTDYAHFYQLFLQSDPIQILPSVKNALDSDKERKRLATYLLKAVLQSYNGQYNPHYLTGLGSTLWLIEQFHQHPDIVLNGLNQYLDFFFSGVDLPPHS